MPASLKLATTDHSGGHRELRKSGIGDHHWLGSQLLAVELNGSLLRRKLLRLGDSDRPSQSVGALDAVPFGLPVADQPWTVMPISHGL